MSKMYYYIRGTVSLPNKDEWMFAGVYDNDNDAVTDIRLHAGDFPAAWRTIRVLKTHDCFPKAAFAKTHLSSKNVNVSNAAFTQKFAEPPSNVCEMKEVGTITFDGENPVFLPPATGGANIKRTNRKISIGCRERCVYVGPRGGEYIKLSGKFVRLKRHC